MANASHLKLLQRGGAAWNAKRPAKPDLSEADLSGLDLQGADLDGANLQGTRFTGANLSGATLAGARAKFSYFWRSRLEKANLQRIDLYKSDLSGARLVDANLDGAKLYRVNFTACMAPRATFRRAHLERCTLSAANLRGASFREANMTEATLVRSNIEGCDFGGARVYGISAWDLRGAPANQQALVITRPKAAPITVDNLKVAQFIYLLLENPEIRGVIDGITSKAVLILGRFSKERKPLLDAIREELRRHDLLPILFDFSIPASRDVSETIRTLAGLARFVIADISDATEVRAELHNIVPDFPSLPVQPIMPRGQRAFVSLRGHLARYPWVLPTFEYDSEEHLLENLGSVVDAPSRQYEAMKSPPAGAAASVPSRGAPETH